jgi:hypothetical protein
MEKISTASATAPEASPMAIYGTMILGQILHALGGLAVSQLSICL